jgi:glutaminyl-peptide cyclotransferase
MQAILRRPLFPRQSGSRRSLPLAGALALPLLLSSCANKTAHQAPTSRRIDELVPQVVKTYPHDTRAFTQGLVYWEGGLYESTGLVGRSSLRRVDPESGAVEAQVSLDPPLFAEGLARVGDELYQLTWQNGRAFVWKMGSFERVREHSYSGEGWGLCYDGKRLVMSDGSDRLTFRNPTDFSEIGSVRVVRAGQPVRQLNELECVDGLVYANLWNSEAIARIDPSNGEVTGWIDASGLLRGAEREGTDVLNGIAYVPERGTFFITGKLWPRLFEVKFVSPQAR